MSTQDQGMRSGYIVVAVVVLIIAFTVFCCLSFQALAKLIPERVQKAVATQQVPQTFVMAYSPEKEEMFKALVDGFNSQVAASNDDVIRIDAVRYEPDLMVEAALEGSLHAISPDSSVWLDTLDRQWQAKTGRESPLVGQTERYAVSPIVIAMWEDVARSMGYPDKPLGWADLLARAQADPEFKWSHASTSSASGLLATLAQFYAGAGKTRGLTEADATEQSTLDYVAAVEKTVRYYGEGEWSVLQRVIEQGRAYLDAFVCQEQLVVYYNTRMQGDRLVAIYPVEGTLWEDHPLALLEVDGLTAKQRATFSRFVEYVKARERQTEILSRGYRPVDLDIPLDAPPSPLTAANGVDPTQPQTALQMPAPSVIEVVRDVWWYTKRHTNVYLVVDVSGSMESNQKLANAQAALRIFMEQIQGDIERVGVVTFSSRASEVVPLDELKSNRAQINAAIDGLEANGDTALLDAVDLAYARLQALGDSERINAIVVMTDGLENNSRTTLGRLIKRVMDENQSGVPVVIFCIGYGSDADVKVLTSLAESSGGQYYAGDLETIRRLYKILSSYF
ncbi:MAG: VWA domain-containing protein [Anaerolineae bacterium]|nr:VWA domain-containing protein [Anaerolineae bacterium]